MLESIKAKSHTNIYTQSITELGTNLFFNNSRHRKKPVRILKPALLAHLLFFHALIFLPAAIQAKERIFHVGYENIPQPPYYLGENRVLDHNPGIAVEMILLLEQKIPGLKVELHRYPWIRCNQYLADGRLDAIFNASFRKDRLKTGHYPWKNGSVDIEKRITTISYALYVRKGAPITWDGSTIVGLGKAKIAAPRGYSIVGDLRGKNIQVEEVNTSEQIMKMILNGRVIAGAMQRVTADNILNKNIEFAQHIKRIEPTLAEKPYYLFISKQFYEQDPELSLKIWDVLKEIRIEQKDTIAGKYRQ